ncbi:MAG: SEL1-like repeat protein [Bauldia sp.]|nr:SEL1-like repeat protein [Bauldia sp.]
MQDISSPEADRSPSLPASHGPLWLWGLAALVVLSAAIVVGAWMAGTRMRGAATTVVSAPAPEALVPDPAAALAEARAALALREAAAAEGDAIAQYEVGLAYLEGALVPPDTDRGIDLIRRAAAQDYIPAMMGLAEALASRVADGTADPAEVFAALDRVIANPPDDRLLGIAHEFYGRYLRDVLPEARRDPARAVDHFVAGLAAGNLILARLIGDAYRTGEGRPADPVTAYAYYKAAQPILPDQLGPTIYALETSLSPPDLERAAALTLPELLAREPGIRP